MPRKPSPILCYVTGRRGVFAGEKLPSPDAPAEGTEARRVQDVLAVIRNAAASAVDWIQVREKDMPTRPLQALVREAVAAARRAALGTRILVNDRLDIALAEDAAGVHLGEDSFPVAAVAGWRQREGESRKSLLIGASCHSLDEARAAGREGADYVFFGPIFDTPSKRIYGSPQGLERLAEVCRALTIPVLAIGGVDFDTARDCLAAGAAGLAAIRLFQEAPDVPALVAALRSL